MARLDRGLAWLGWVLDAFDFTIFLMIMSPIAKTFNVPLVEVTAVFTITLWMRLIGATASAMEQWPQRSRGLMGSVLQSSWGLGALLSSAAYGLLYNHIGWRGLLMLGVLPALLLVYIRTYVKEPAIWLENRRIQRTQRREVRLPLLSIFKWGMLFNTLTAC